MCGNYHSWNCEGKILNYSRCYQTHLFSHDLYGQKKLVELERNLLQNPENSHQILRACNLKLV